MAQSSKADLWTRTATSPCALDESTAKQSPDSVTRPLRRHARRIKKKVPLLRSLKTLQEKLIKVAARVVRDAEYVIFQMLEVAWPRELLARILDRI